MQIQHQPDQQQFVIKQDGHDDALLKYHVDSNGSMDIYKTFVPTSLRGQGVAGKLVDAAAKWAEQNKLSIHPTCWYAAKRLASK